MSKFIEKNIANFITLLRIPLAFGMIFFPVFSIEYYIFFSLAGITDAIDGPIARKMGTSGRLGAQIDSVADITFFVIALAKMIPYALENLNSVSKAMFVIVIALRVFCYIAEVVKFKRMVSLHTYLNKATSVSMFIGIYFIPFIGISIPCIIGCSFAMLAVAEEITIIFTTKEPENDTHTICHARKNR